MKKAAKEFVVIVLGVLTALLGESLLGEWRDAAKAQRYRASIAADLEQDIRMLQERVAFYDRVVDSGRIVASWLESGGAERSPDEMLGYVVAAAFMETLSPTTDAWDDLTSTGQIGLLEEHERIALGAYFRRNDERSQLGPLPTGYRQAILGMMPAETVERVCDGCILYDSLETTLPPCEADFGPTVEDMLTRIRSLPLLARELNIRMYRVGVEASFLDQMEDRAQEALDHLRSEM